MARLKVMTANVQKLAANQYGDSTDFVQIMQTNYLNDLIINGPISAVTSSPSALGDSQIIVNPTDGLQLGWIITFVGISGYSIITNIKQNYSIPGGLPFCSCDKNRILPPTGQRISTTICLAPMLPTDILSGQPVLFTVGVPTTIKTSDTPSALRGRIF